MMLGASGLGVEGGGAVGHSRLANGNGADVAGLCNL